MAQKGLKCNTRLERIYDPSYNGLRMNCPTCRNFPLAVLELHYIEVDYCPNCHGVWLDSGEIELLFGDPEACRQFLDSGQPVGGHGRETHRLCPICDKPMSKRTTAGHDTLTFDRCSHSDGLWLDQGELARVLAHPLAVPQPVGSLLMEIFGNFHEAK